VRKIALELVTGAETEFTDRGCILAQIVEWAERVRGFPSSYSAVDAACNW